MDLASIGIAYEGLKVAKNTIKTLSSLKIETDTIGKINEAVKQVGDAQDTLFQLREELFKLQEENKKLKDEISESEEWVSKKSKYELVETDGGAVVYKSLEGTPHFACPSCMERRQIQILQDRRVVSGIFDCPGCSKSFPVKPVKQVQQRRLVRS